jgi:hypothetical protein
LALVFNRHSFHQLGCGFVLRRLSHLVDRRTPFVEVAILRHLLARIVTVRHSRELGKEKSETKQSPKWKASGKTAQVNKTISTAFPVSAFTRHLAKQHAGVGVQLSRFH